MSIYFHVLTTSFLIKIFMKDLEDNHIKIITFPKIMRNSCNTAYSSVTDDLTAFFMLAKCGQKKGCIYI